jgi:hypothetical protein
MKTESKTGNGKNISRRDALEKAGKYALFTAAASILILSPKQAHAVSAIDPTGKGWDSGGGGGDPYNPPGGGNKNNKRSPWGEQQKPKESSFGDRNTAPWQ